MTSNLILCGGFRLTYKNVLFGVLSRNMKIFARARPNFTTEDFSNRLRCTIGIFVNFNEEYICLLKMWLFFFFWIILLFFKTIIYLKSNFLGDSVKTNDYSLLPPPPKKNIWLVDWLWVKVTHRLSLVKIGSRSDSGRFRWNDPPHRTVVSENIGEKKGKKMKFNVLLFLRKIT